jgi:eukaryotic-like serine/threonine-protein kinase
MDTPHRLKRVKQIFLTALDHDPRDVSAFLSDACGGDATLYSRVESLLAIYRQNSDFLRSPALNLSATDVAAILTEDDGASVVGQRVGDYRIVREIGCGGMGAVYLAKRDDGEYDQQVAIKLIRHGLDREMLRRFRHERQIMATLNHPNIARLLDGGMTEDGQPYFVMEYVEGRPLDQYADACRLPTEERLKLFLAICSAVEYAHQHNVIHRDLKPSNILVTDDATPKLLDFGIAKLLNTDSSEPTGEATLTAFRVMTPEYASPEQLRGLAVTPASDVYSLGVLLYELLTGRRPYQFKSRLPHEILRTLLETNPSRPSLIVTQAKESPANVSSTEPDTDELRRRLRGDLDNIILMAIRKEPERRYRSVGEFSEDLRRHLQGLPVIARKELLLARTAKFLKRHRLSATLTVVIAILCLVSGLLLGALTTDTRAQKSLAVLPLANDSQAPNMEYLADGMTDALIDYLSQLPRLTVPSHNAVFQYKGQAISPQAVGSTLGVKAVLTGSVNQDGENLFINLNLIETQTDRTLRHFKYTGKTSELLSMQRQIAQDVANTLDMAPGGEQSPSLRQQGTADVEAYRLYLKGQYFLNQMDPKFLNKGIEYFRQAVDKDPNYALAYSGLANCYSLLGTGKAAPPKEVFPEAKKAALKAVELAPELAEAHTSLAVVAWHYDWDWASADREFRRAIELNPDYSTAPDWYGLYLAEMGRFEEAIASVRRALELDPASVDINAGLGRVLFYARRYDESLEQYRKTIEMAPIYAAFYAELAYLYEQMGLADEWLAAREKLTGRVPELYEAYLKHGIKGYWQKSLELHRSHQSWDDFYSRAQVYARLGEIDKAIEQLNKAFEVRDHQMAQLKVNPLFDPLRSDPRFQELLRRMKLDS